MKDFVKLYFKGLLVGMGKVIPGVSGCLIAITLNIYETSINALCNLMKDFKKKFIYLFPILLGVITSIVLGSKYILYLYLNYYNILIPIIIAALIPPIIKLLKSNCLSLKNNFFLFLIPVVIIKSISLINIKSKNVFLLGFVEAISMIIPGLSGTAIFLILDSYETVLNIYSHPITLNSFLFFLSFLIIFISFCKIFDYLIKKYSKQVNLLIASFSTMSLIMIVLNFIEKINFFSFKSLLIIFITIIVSFKFN